MVCKEEVVHWFKGLESYKRIDAMCTLLNMCLPFELRFLGTCLEELGGRDSKELRGIELRVNNSNELAQEIASSQLCDPSDIKVRRKMALYFALIRACNRPCVNELFNILCSWNNNEFLKRAKGDALQELLLVYTMAAYHPVFSFEQRMRCGEIYSSILCGNPEVSFAEVPVVDSLHAKSVDETNPSSTNVLYSQKHISSEQIMPVFGIQNPSANSTQVAFDQNRGSQIVHREIVGISPHHIYSEGVQQGFPHNIAHVCQTTTSNVASFPVSRPNQLSQQQPTLVPQAPTHQHTINTSNATNLTYSLQGLSLMDNNIVYVHNDPNPINTESDSNSSGESNEDSSPPDTPLNTDIIGSSNSGVSGSSSGSNSNINKSFKARGDSKPTSRHKVSAQRHPPPPPQPPHQLLYAPVLPSAALNSDIVIAANVTTQPQSQQTSMPQPHQPTAQTLQSINSPTGAMQAIGIANPQIIFQQYAQATTHPMQKSQMNQTYPYTQPHIPMNNRSSISNTTTSATQAAAATYRLPTNVYHMQPNGEMIYQLPNTFSFMPQTALPLTRTPSTCNQTHTVVPTPPPPTMQHLPTLTSLSSKSNQNTMVSSFLLANENAKPNTSCFNCGSSQHTGQECQEASMEDVTRGIYKLDYNSTPINDTVKTAPELDNGSGTQTTESIGTHMPPSVINK